MQKYVSWILLISLVLFNTYLYRAELTIRSDVNDNSFQFALVDEASKIMHQVLAGKASPMYLFDSFNERWNEGFSLSNYYSHVPQMIIAGIATTTQTDPHIIFNLLKFLFLVGLPISFFIASRILGQSYLFAIMTSIFSQLINTDGLYGIDATSYLWRGWGLSSQLFAVFFLPFAFAYTYQYITNKKHFKLAILCNILVASCHSGVFFMLAMSYPVIVILHYFQDRRTNSMINFAKVVGLTGLFLSYFFIPFFTQSNYRNFSYWDPIWKFNSYGIIPVLSWLLNGQLFDFGRLPILTMLVLFGFLYCLISNMALFRLFGTLFILYLCLFIGMSPFGPIISHIPGLSEFHLHRFVVAVQFVSIFIAAYSVEQLGLYSFKRYSHISTHIQRAGVIIVFIVMIVLLLHSEKPLINYAADNTNWIGESNQVYSRDIVSYRSLINKIQQYNGSRIYAGRPGNWGHDLKVGSTPLYMHLAQDGYRTIGYAPESWSPNAEPDQFFDDNNLAHYQLYNVQLTILPKNVTPPSFASLIQDFGPYKLYKVDFKTNSKISSPPVGGGWFTSGKSNLIFVGKKTHFANISHLWLYSKMFANQNYPHILFTGDRTNYADKYYYTLLDLNSYQDNNGKIATLWQRNPVNLDFGAPTMIFKKVAETQDFQKYTAKYEVTGECNTCIIILKQTYHPNWTVRVNNQLVKIYPVFPFYIGIPIEKPGIYNIEALYKPNYLKVVLLLFGVTSAMGLYIYQIKKRKK